jgi:hypothetical protein
VTIILDISFQTSSKKTGSHLIILLVLLYMTPLQKDIFTAERAACHLPRELSGVRGQARENAEIF